MFVIIGTAAPRPGPVSTWALRRHEASARSTPSCRSCSSFGVLLAGPTLLPARSCRRLRVSTSGRWWMGTWADAGSAMAPSTRGKTAGTACGPCSSGAGAGLLAVRRVVHRSDLRGRSVREFVIGIVGDLRHLIGVVSGRPYDETRNGVETPQGRRTALARAVRHADELPYWPVFFVLLLAATILVGTYYLDIAGFRRPCASASCPRPPGRRDHSGHALVAGIAAIAFLLLSIGERGRHGSDRYSSSAPPIPIVVLLTMATPVRQESGAQSQQDLQVDLLALRARCFSRYSGLRRLREAGRTGAPCAESEATVACGSGALQAGIAQGFRTFSARLAPSIMADSGSARTGLRLPGASSLILSRVGIVCLDSTMKCSRSQPVGNRSACLRPAWSRSAEGTAIGCKYS